MVQGVKSIGIKESWHEKNKEDFAFRAPPGLNEEVVRMISKDKNEPEWMLRLRLKSLELFHKMPLPRWGPDLSKLNLNNIYYYGNPNAKKNSRTWNEVPADIKKTFERLGIPEAERKALGGVGAQYESMVVYHNLKKEWEDQGVIFLDMDEAVQKYPELVRENFMTKCIPIGDHKFIALHGAVWSGGTFIHIPKGVKVTLPLQAYFRMNAEKSGQFEHTLIIVEDDAEVSYVEGCFTKGTRITTNPDIKLIEDVKVGDMVFTHTGEYKRVYHTQVRPYTGNLYNIEIYGDSMANIEVTEEHPFLYVKRQHKNDRNKKWHIEWTKPDKLEKRDYLAIPRNKVVKKAEFHEFEIDKYDNESKKFVKIKKKIPLIKEFFRLVGYYLAEGSVSSGHYVNFSFGSHEEKYLTDVEQIISKISNAKFKRQVHKKNKGTSIVINSTELVRIFKNFGTQAAEKEIPHWILLEDHEKQKELVIGLFRGDGNYYKRKHNSGYKEVFRINTTSEKLAVQLRSLLIRLGIPAFLNKRNRIKPRVPIYTVGISGEHMKNFGDIVGIKVEEKLNGKNRASMFGVDENYVYVPIKKISKKRVEEIPVYNFSVESDDSYVAEGVAVHNCSAPQYSSNSLHAGCVEIIVGKRARARYSSVENWSKNTYNLNTKRAVVGTEGTMEWIGGNMGSCTTMLYPCTILKGDRSRAYHLSIAYAGNGQNQDTGSKVYHFGKDTTSVVKAKSISKDGGITTYRGLLKIGKDAINSKSNVQCDALILDEISKSNTIPFIDIKEDKVSVGHEATVGKISDEQIFYLMSRGIKQEQAMQMIVCGFIEPIIKELPLEYAVELNRLIQLEMEGSVG